MTRFVNVGSNDQHALFCGFIVTIATILRTPCVGHDVIALVNVYVIAYMCICLLYPACQSIGQFDIEF